MKNNQNHLYAVIMAGGTGSRLWPISRQGKPKQFQPFISPLTMIQETFERLKKVVPVKNIFICTAERYRMVTLEQLPEIKEDQLIIEPMPRGTAVAISLIAHFLRKKDSQAVVATIASDHAIKNVEEFVFSVKGALETAKKFPEKLVTVGINPNWPDPDLGYIQMGKEKGLWGGRRIFEIEAFTEKPDKKTAEKYLASWAYLWNAGYFVFSADQMIKWMKKYSPEISQIVGKLLNNEKEKKIGVEEYRNLKNIPIEPILVEKLPAKNRLVVPSEMQWSDVGNWGTLFDFFRSDFESSMIVKGNHIDEGSRDCFIQGQEKLIATLGLKNTIIIESADVILVADRSKVPEVKKIIEKLKKQNKHLYL